MRLPDLPIATASATAIVIARNVYICGGLCPGSDATLDQIVQVYDLDKEVWIKLPPAPQYNSEAASINNRLVLIGGWDSSSDTITNMVSSWTGQGWVQDILALPFKRAQPSVMTYGTYVIVAGGMAEDNHTLLSSIDVLNTTTRQWQTPANLQLPFPMYAMQMTICATHIYVVGEATTNASAICMSVWHAPVNSLLSILEKEDKNSLQWVETTPTPFYHSVLLQHTAHPLGIGGHDVLYKPTHDIAIYNHRSNKWSTVGQLLEPRAMCTAVSLGMCSFFVCGGCSDAVNSQSVLNSVELVHML